MSAFPVYPLETPAVRTVEIVPVMQHGQQLLLIQDPLGIIDGVLALVPDPVLMILLQTANGERTVAEIAEIARDVTGLIITADKVRNIVRELDEVSLLLSESLIEKLDERKQKYRNMPMRESIVFNSDDRLLLIKQLTDEFERHRYGKNSPPSQLNLPSVVRAVLSPHIDYARGGETYAWAYKAIAEHTMATTFIILGTLHRPSTHFFIATDKNFRTPLGTVEIDHDMLNELKREFQGELFTDEYLHAHEHTIELQVMYLQQALKVRKFKILPILVGSFEEFLHVDPPIYPSDDSEVTKFIETLKTLMQRHGERVVLIGGVDFSHCGPEFGDDELNHTEREEEIRYQDNAMLEAIEEVNPKKFFDSFRPTMNQQKVCSISPIYCVLAALEGEHKGTTLKYQQANSQDRQCLVSFASVAFTPKEQKKKIILL